MSKVTSKLQVTIPKKLAERYGIEPGDEIEWEAAGDAIRVVPGLAPHASGGLDTKLEMFDRAGERQRAREEARGKPSRARKRGWTREELHDRGRPR